MKPHKAAALNLDHDEQDQEYGSKGIEEELYGGFEEHTQSNEYEEEPEFNQHKNLVKRQKID